MNTLDQVIQKQVDYIMDSFDFKSASEALRCVEQLETFGQVRDLMKRLHDQNVSTSYAAHAVWKVLSNGSGITANQEALAKDIARSLHEMSILRHGMFTPVEFEAIVANRIRSFFYSQNIEDTHGAKWS